MCAVERVRRNHVLQHFDRIVLNQTHVFEPTLLDLLEQAAYARRMNVERQIIVPRRAERIQHKVL